jgi:hypothetical protein
MEQLFRFGATVSVELMIEATSFVSMGVCFCTSAALVDDCAREKGPSCRPVALALRYLELQHENGDPQTQNPDF